MKPRLVSSTFAGAGLLSVLAAATIAASGSPTAPGLAYDEVTKVAIGGATPEPGTFSSDFSAAVNAQRSVAAPGSHHGLLGGLMNTMDLAKSAMNMLKNGTASSAYYLSGWSRIDDPGQQTATIVKPQQNQTVVLNLAKKTYRLVEPNAPVGAQTPPPSDAVRNASGQPAQPGTGKLDIAVSTTSLGSRIIEGVPTTGYKTTFNLTETQSTGSCSDGTFQTTTVDYISNYSEPRITTPSRAMAAVPKAHPEMMALKPGCVPKVTMRASGSAKPPGGRLSMWTLITIAAGAPSAQGQMSGGFSTLIERGNVRSLTPADGSLFAIPPDFTKEQ